MSKPSLSICKGFRPCHPGRSRAQRAVVGTVLFTLLTTAVHAGPGSLWKEDSSKSIVADKRARAVGDIITILVQENNTASKENSTQTSKSSSVDASVDTLFYP